MKFACYKRLLVVLFFSSYLNLQAQQVYDPRYQQPRTVVYNPHQQNIRQLSQPGSLQNSQQLLVKHVPILAPNNMILSMIAIGSSSKNIWGVARIKVAQQGFENSYIVKKTGKQWRPIVAGKHVSIGKDGTVVILDNMGNVYSLKKNNQWKALPGVKLSKIGVASKDLMWGSVKDNQGVYHIFVYNNGRWKRAKNYGNENAVGFKNFTFSNDGTKLFAVDDLGKVFKYSYKQAIEIKGINKNTGIKKNLNKARKKRLKKLIKKIKKLKSVKNKTKKQIKRLKKLTNRRKKLKKKLKKSGTKKKKKSNKKNKKNKKKINKKKIIRNIQKIQNRILKLNKIQNRTPKQNKRLKKLNSLLEKYNKKIKNNN